MKETFILIKYFLLFSLSTTPIISLQVAAAEVQKPLIFLCLEGGGMHMCAALETIRRIEDICGFPISDGVDGIIGLSSGAVIAAHLLAPNNLGQARWSAEKLKEALPNMFINGALGSAFGGRLSSCSLGTLKTTGAHFKESIGDAFMQQALKRLLIVSYNSHEKKSGVIDSHEKAHHNVPIWNAAEASVSIVAQVMGIELSSGPTAIQFGTDYLSPGWIDGGLGPHDPLYKILADKLIEEYPKREIIIYSFAGGYFPLTEVSPSPVTKLEHGKVTIVCFQAIYKDIAPTSFWLNTWYLMLLNPSSYNIANIEAHFFSKELLNSPEYLAMFVNILKLNSSDPKKL